jgi:hypothetical protein
MLLCLIGTEGSAFHFFQIVYSCVGGSREKEGDEEVMLSTEKGKERKRKEKEGSPERGRWTSSKTAGASSGSRWRSSKSQSGECGVSQEEDELAGIGVSCGEKNRDVVSESKGQASAQADVG